MSHSASRTVTAIALLLIGFCFPLRVYSQGTITLSSPTNGATNVPLTVTLSWRSVSNASQYVIEVFVSPSDSAIFVGFSLSPSIVIPGLSYNSTYGWLVWTLGGLGEITSPEWYFQTAAQLPAPTLSSPSQGSANQPTGLSLAWGTVAYATSYGVQVSTGSAFSSTIAGTTGLTSSGAFLNSLVNGTTYYWEANAANVNGPGPWSAAWSFATWTVPGAPVLVSPANTATNLPVNGLTLAWSSSAGPSPNSYALQLSTNNFNSTLYSWSAITAGTDIIGRLATATSYYWRVNATATGAGSSASNKCMVERMDLHHCSPADCTGAFLAIQRLGQSAGKPHLFLGQRCRRDLLRFPGIVKFEFQHNHIRPNRFNRADPGGGRPSLCNGMVLACECSRTGRYRLLVDHLELYDLDSPTRTDACSAIQRGQNPGTAITLSWNSVQQCTGYRIQYSISSTFSILSDTMVTGFSRVASPLTANLTYYWRVNSMNVAGSSAWSGIWSFTVTATAALPENLFSATPAFSVKNGIATYALTRRCPVELMVYDALGRELFTFRRVQQAGTYSIPIRTMHLPAQLYIVRFRAGSFENG